MKISEPIVFVRLSFSLPGQRRKIDAGATAESQKIDPKRLAASARLFTGQAFAAIRANDSATRQALLGLAINVPAAFRGSYVLPRKLMDRVEMLLAGAKERREELVVGFVAEEYDSEREQAKTELGNAFDPADYPDADGLMAKFDMGWSYFALDVPEDLPTELRERETAKLQARINQVADDCRNALRQGMAKLVEGLVEKLKPGEDGKTKRLYASSVSTLKEFLDTLAARDITSDDAIRTLGERAKAIIGDVSADDLRASTDVATRIRAGLEAVAGEVENLIKSDGRKIDFNAWKD